MYIYIIYIYIFKHLARMKNAVEPTSARWACRMRQLGHRAVRVFGCYSRITLENMELTTISRVAAQPARSKPSVTSKRKDITEHFPSLR